MKTNDSKSKSQKVLTIIGIVLCVILIPMLIVNCTLIIKSFVNEDEVPDFAGVVPLIVLTDSMYPDIKSGDLILTKTADADEIEVGDVISFTDPAGNGTSIVTHMVIEKYEEDGITYFRTQGINNKNNDGELVADKLPVSEDKLIGEYTGIRIGGAGKVALFMQTLPGLIICVVVPILLFVGYDVLRRRKHDKANQSDVDALKAELEALKAEKAKAEAEAKVEEPANAEVENNDAE